jgi:hypothetical protein
MGSLPGRMEVPHAGKKRRILFEDIFISSLTWRWGENLSLPVFNRARGRSGQIQAYTYGNSQAPQDHVGRNFFSSLTKGLQLKWSSLGSEEMEMGQGGRVECYKSGTDSNLPQKVSGDDEGDGHTRWIYFVGVNMKTDTWKWWRW